MFDDDQLLPLSAVQHHLYCPRQAALIHLEQVWAENRFTAEGNLLHEKAHMGEDDYPPGMHVTRTMPVVSRTLGITGQCDIVEFHADGLVVPVEYKRGKPKSHRADEVQLCAQATCLEEMLQVNIPQGYIFYGQRKRRTSVTFDEALRSLTADTCKAIHSMFASQRTPLAFYEARKCDQCSLIHHCQPHALRLKRGAAAWFTTALAAQNPSD